MDETQISHFEFQLRARKVELLDLSSTSEDAAKTVELDQAAVGRLSRMDAIRAQSMAIETKNRREQELLRIDAALRRITSDDFGFCLSCGDDMNIRRLEVDPSYTHCISCAD